MTSTNTKYDWTFWSLKYKVTMQFEQNFRPLYQQNVENNYFPD